MKVSVITIIGENSDGLAATYNSLLKHYDGSFNWIILTTDDSISPISDTWVKVHIESRNLNDIALFNQAVEYAQGDYILFLNNGSTIDDKSDLYSAISSVSEDVIWGNIVSNDDGFCYSYPQREDFSMFYLIEHPLPLQSTLIKRSTFEKYSGFDINNSIAFDFDFFLKSIVSSQCTVRFAPKLSVCANPFSFEKHVRRTTEILNTIVIRYPRLIGEDNPQLRLPSEIHSAMCFWRFLQNNTMINLLYNVCIKPFIRKNK